MKVYFVTTHHDLLDPKKSDSRTVGYFHTLKEAKQVVEENQGDIFEFYYRHATIEGICDGLYPLSIEDADKTLFYEWDLKEQRYKRIQKPESLESLIGFSNIG